MTENVTHEAPATDAEVTAELTQEQEDLLEALRDVVDPELGINVVDLGLVYGVDVEGLVADFRINWVWMPPWGPENITEDGREQLRALGFNI